MRISKLKVEHPVFHINRELQRSVSNLFKGKQLVYHALQDPNESTTQEDLGRIDAQIVAIREENASTTATIKELRSQLSLLSSAVSTADLRTSVEKMEAEKEAITARLIMLKTGDVKPVRKEEKEAIDEDMRKWERIARNRSKIIKDMWGSVLDALPEGVNAADLRVRPTSVLRLEVRTNVFI